MKMKDKILKENKKEETNNIIRIIKGCAVSICITMIMLVILSVILAKTTISEEFINPMIIIITAFSIFLGSIISTLKIERKGLINGTIIGIVYFGVMYIISSIANSNFSLNFNSLILISLSIFFGMIGGIIGVNLKKKF